MALIKCDYDRSYLQNYVERYTLSCDVCQAANTLPDSPSPHRCPTPNGTACLSIGFLDCRQPRGVMMLL